MCSRLVSGRLYTRISAMSPTKFPVHENMLPPMRTFSEKGDEAVVLPSIRPAMSFRIRYRVLALSAVHCINVYIWVFPVSTATSTSAGLL